MTEPVVGMKFGNEKTAMTRLKQIAEKEHVTVEKSTKKQSDGGFTEHYSVKKFIPYTATVAGLTIFNFDDGTKFNEFNCDGLLYLSSGSPEGNQDNKPFTTIVGEKYRAEDRNYNGIVDKGEIFPR